MGTNFAVLFYARKNVKTRRGNLPIYLRVTIDGARFDTTISRQIESEKWIAKIGRAKGLTEDAKQLNSYLDNVRTKVFNYQQEIFKEGKELNVETFKE